MSILYLSNRAKLALPDVTLEPAGTATVDINSGLQSLGIASYATLSGYVEIQYKWPWIPICAMIRNLDTVHSLVFLHSAQPLPTGTSASGPQAFEGMWWKQEANETGFVALMNTSAQPMSAALRVSDKQGAQLAAHNVTISQNGTKIVNLQELQSLSQTEGGLRITYTGAAGALIASGGLEDPGRRVFRQFALYPCSGRDQDHKNKHLRIGSHGGRSRSHDVVPRRNDVHALFPGSKHVKLASARDLDHVVDARRRPAVVYVSRGESRAIRDSQIGRRIDDRRCGVEEL